jgi:hypothetical protein
MANVIPKEFLKGLMILYWTTLTTVTIQVREP